MPQPLKIGFFCIGLDTYWPQFKGLLPRLMGYKDEIAEKLKAFSVEIIDAGMVDNPFKAKQAADTFAKSGIDAVCLFISTYALSHTVLPVVQACKVPVMILNLQPVPAIDYTKLNSMKDRGEMTGEWLAHCQACALPEIASVFNRGGVEYQIFTGYLRDKLVWEDLENWIAALHVKKSMSCNRLGIVGHYYNGMLDVYTDLTLQSAVFGTHIELIEFGVIKKLREEASESEVKLKIDEFHRLFEVSADCDDREIVRAAKTALALDKMVADYQLGALAYYYEGVGDPVYEDIITSVIPGFTLLTGRDIPVAGECEVKNAQAMKIMALFGAGGSFSEFYAMDFNDDVVLLGHDGPAHPLIAEGKVGLVPLPVYHGKPGKGLSIQMRVKNGPVTLLSVVQTKEGRIGFLTAEGESVPGDTLQIGNTNSRYRFSCGTRAFINNWSMAGPSHHCAVGIGHISRKIEYLAGLLGVDFMKIC